MQIGERRKTVHDPDDAEAKWKHRRFVDLINRGWRAPDALAKMRTEAFLRPWEAKTNA